MQFSIKIILRYSVKRVVKSSAYALLVDLISNLALVKTSNAAERLNVAKMKAI
jgi:hypothetical protein